MASNVSSLTDHMAALHAQLVEIEARTEAVQLKSGGGGGTFDGMEARVAVLESHVEHIREDLAKLSGMPAETAELKVKIDNLPTKDWVSDRLDKLLGKQVTVTALIVAVIGIAIKFLPLGT